MDKKRHIVAITAVIKNKEENKVLIIKRNKNEIAYPSKWAFPGGKMERGEDILTTLKREVLEEVGLIIEDYKEFLKDYTFVRSDDENVIGLAFLAKALSDEVKLSSEFEDYAWVSLDELREYDHIQGMEEEVKLALNIKT